MSELDQYCTGIRGTRYGTEFSDTRLKPECRCPALPNDRFILAHSSAPGERWALIKRYQWRKKKRKASVRIGKNVTESTDKLFKSINNLARLSCQVSWTVATKPSQKKDSISISDQIINEICASYSSTRWGFSACSQVCCRPLTCQLYFLPSCYKIKKFPHQLFIMEYKK